MSKATTIHISNTTHSGNIDGAHNGVRFSVPVGQDVAVNEGTLTALQDSGVDLRVVSPSGGAAGEGSPAASTTVIGTATRDVPANTGTDLVGNDADAKPVTLSQLVDKDVTDASKTQAANADTSDKGTGITTAQRGLPVDNSSAAASSAAKPKARKAKG